MRLRKMESKIVINVESGEILGSIHDIEIDTNSFEINTIFVEEKSGVLERMIPWIFKSKSHKISVHKIESIGNDTILVRMGK